MVITSLKDLWMGLNVRHVRKMQLKDAQNVNQFGIVQGIVK